VWVCAASSVSLQCHFRGAFARFGTDRPEGEILPGARGTATISNWARIISTKLIDVKGLAVNLADCDEGGLASDLSNILNAARTRRTRCDGVT
jgi:hypothetical protein